MKSINIYASPRLYFHIPVWLKIDLLGGKLTNLATRPAVCCCWHGMGPLIRLIAGVVFFWLNMTVSSPSVRTHTCAFAKTCKKCSIKKSTDLRAGTLLKTDRCAFADSVQVWCLSYTLKWEKLPPGLQWWDFAFAFNYTLCHDLIMRL